MSNNENEDKEAGWRLHFNLILGTWIFFRKFVENFQVRILKTELGDIYFLFHKLTDHT